MDIQTAAKKLLERCFWHRVTVFFYEVRTVLNIYQEKMQKRYLYYNYPTFVLLNNMIHPLHNWDTLIFRFREQAVDIDVLSRFLQAVEFNLEKLITLLENSIQIHRSDFYPDYMQYIKMTVDMGLALSNNIDYVFYLKNWAIQHLDLFWPSILQPIHRQLPFQSSVQENYHGIPPSNDQFSENHDVVEFSAMQMTSSELEYLSNLFQDVAKANLPFFFEFIEKMTKVQYFRFKHPAERNKNSECFAYLNEGFKILKFLECFPIIPYFEFDALSPETADRIMKGKIQFEFHEPFKIYQTKNENWAICLPSDFETAYPNRR